MTYEEKSEIVIRQLREDRDRLLDALDKIRAEIADLDDAEYEFEGYYKAVNDALQIIDKYR